MSEEATTNTNPEPVEEESSETVGGAFSSPEPEPESGHSSPESPPLEEGNDFRLTDAVREKVQEQRDENEVPETSADQ